MCDLSFVQMVLGIVAGVLLVPVVGLMVIGMFTGAFAALRWAWGVLRG